MRRMTKSAVLPVRNAQLLIQGNICPLCEEFIQKDDAVLDHDHASGLNRAVLHRHCNAALGKIENARAINNLKDPKKFEKWCKNIPSYIENAKMDSYHWTHRTAEEKKERTRVRAQKKRKQAKLNIGVL